MAPTRRQSIGSRIFVGYGVIMALALGFMLIVVALLISANTRQVEALERRQRLETNALRLELAVQQESDAVSGYLLRGDEEYLDPYRQSVLLHQAALNELQSLVLTDADEAALERVRKLYLAFLIEANTQIDAYREESKENSIAMWQTTGRERKDDLNKAINSFAATNRQSIDLIVADADDRRQNTSLLTTLLLVIAGISVVLSGRRVTRSITKPVDHLVDVASSFSQGLLDRRAEINSNDELATLARVMNGMAGNLAQSRSAVQLSLQETEERNRQLAALNNLADALSQSLELRVILDRALDQLLDLAKAERGFVWLLEGDRLTDEPLLTHGLDSAMLAALGGQPSRSYLLAVARQGEIVVKSQPSPLAHATHADAAPGFSILVPLVSGDRPLGLLSLSGDRLGQADSVNLELYEAIGRQIGVGVENARLFAAEQRLTREALGLADTASLVSGSFELDQILPIIARSALALLTADRGAIVLVDHTSGLEPSLYRAGRSFGEPAVEQAFADALIAVIDQLDHDHTVLTVNDVAADARAPVRRCFSTVGARSGLVVVLQARGRTLGALYVDYVDRRHEFTDHDRRVVLALADQAAVGIEGALLYAGVQERAQQLAGLYEIAKVIAATLDQEELSEVLYRETRRLMDADIFEVALAQPAEAIQRIVFRIDRDQRMPVVTIPATAGLSGYVMRQRQSLLVTGAAIDALDVQTWRGSNSEQRSQSIISAPLTREGTVLGVVSAQSYRPQAYHPGHLELFEAIANQAATAIENGQLQRQALDLAVIEERNRLARELHDSVTQMLFSITLTLQAGRVLINRNTAQAEQQMEKAQQTAQEALAEMRALIYQLRPSSLADRGLIAALTSYIDIFQQRTGLTVTFRHEGLTTFGEAHEQALFRIVQESLNNVVKHADATNVDVALSCQPDEIVLRVRDDGRGFGPSKPANAAPTWGILGMRERTEVLGGDFTIAPGAEGGVEIVARFPIASPELVTGSGSKEAKTWS